MRSLKNFLLQLANSINQIYSNRLKSQMAATKNRIVLERIIYPS